MSLLWVYRSPAEGIPLADCFSGELIGTEWRYYVECREPVSPQSEERLVWLLGETFLPNGFGGTSYLGCCAEVVEYGPRLNFSTAWGTTATEICRRCGITEVVRMERTRRYGFKYAISSGEREVLDSLLHDRMTEMPYREPLESLSHNLTPDPMEVIPVLEQGEQALNDYSRRAGFGWDEQDIAIVKHLFFTVLKRNPTDVELMQLAQANSDHSRHWGFRGCWMIDGVEIGRTLMDVVKSPWQHCASNSVIAFCDDSSAIEGFEETHLIPVSPGDARLFRLASARRHFTLTAETHNHPCAVAPKPGADTAAGGRIRDNLGVGIGGFMGVSGAGYCTSNLLIPGYDLPWEKGSWKHPVRMASPLDIMIQASNGCAEYGNRIGEPCVYGFVRTAEFHLEDEHRSYHKPIVYSIGAGQIDSRHVKKKPPQEGMLVVMIGGPAYRIGVGGGAASSMIAGANDAELDFDSVQRGDAEMEQRVWRWFQSCVEMGDDNPIESAHDLGAGGTANAVPEIAEPAGALIELRDLPNGDNSMSKRDLWGNEAQERMVVLIREKKLAIAQAIAVRENVPMAVIGRITGDGVFTVHDASDDSIPVRLPLKDVLGELPQKMFKDEHVETDRKPLELSSDLTVREALERVLRLPSVASKRWLMTKKDRSVTGRVAQQQCCGPFHTPVSDFAVMASSYFGLSGVVLSLGEQPLKGMISGPAMARMAVGEALLNMSGALITRLSDVKCQANWMLAARQPGEGAWLWDSALALEQVCLDLGIAIDGGKDSSSMAAVLQNPETELWDPTTVKAPGQLVIGAYAPMADITRKVTPDLKCYGNRLLWLDLSGGKRRLGGSALAQVYSQVGDDTPDMDDPAEFKEAFAVVQALVGRGLIKSLHDCSDGGLIVCLLEMAFAGNLGLAIDLAGHHGEMAELFCEELGLVMEVSPRDAEAVGQMFADAGMMLAIKEIGAVLCMHEVRVNYNAKQVLKAPLCELRWMWEETSTKLDELQADQNCVAQEAQWLRRWWLANPPYRLSFDPVPTDTGRLTATRKPVVAILREQGSNGDREMAAAFFAAGFEPWDVTMTDLLEGRVSLDRFCGVAFVGGFSFADVLDAGKGWAGVIRFNGMLREQFDRFYNRTDTFSFGVCNGCQLMALLGWVPGIADLAIEKQPRFIRNTSGRFESRFPTVRIDESPAIMLKSMAGSQLGIWTAHGEGRLYVPDADLFEALNDLELMPIRYVDLEGRVTSSYPANPNGSAVATAALCSPDGRHLAMMPHPERCFLKWQWPWMSGRFRDLPVSPWLQLFQNAYDWVMNP